MTKNLCETSSEKIAAVLYFLDIRDVFHIYFDNSWITENLREISSDKMAASFYLVDIKGGFRYNFS